jgi:DEAD/DEAH box helicase domain-containing protein
VICVNDQHVRRTLVRMVPFEQLLRGLAQSDELVHLEVTRASSARFAAETQWRDGLGGASLGVIGERPLWVHQAEAIGHALSGRSVVVATGTASGKSLCYQVPLVEAVGTGGTTLMLFPTKALAQDQLRSLGALNVGKLTAVTYDGDTVTDARLWARRNANVVLTNPDMLHQGLLPYHSRWAKFLGALRYVVVDELHTYRGIFGSHVAHVLRRLRRVCAYYGSSPVFISTSATVGQPGLLAEAVTGIESIVVDDDGSPRGERVLALWNPPADTSGVPVSGNASTARLLSGLVTEGYRTIAFTRGRRSTEVVAARAKSMVPDAMASTIRPYRGGYLPAERRAIEAEMFDGRLQGIAATNALELGVDIGGLDACICNGFPGTISSFRQQIGRAGRSAQRSLAVLVAGDDALDQWYAANPRQLVVRPPEPVIVNPANPFVLLPQVACAAHEMPIDPQELQRAYGFVSDAASMFDPLRPPQLDDAVEDAVHQLLREEQLVAVNGRAVYAGTSSPASRVSLRSGSGSSEYRIVDAKQRLIGTVDGGRAFAVLHPGALYLHQGQQYRIGELDRTDHVAYVDATSVDEYTQARSDTQLRFLKIEQAQTIGRVRVCLGRVEVEEQVVGYQRKKISTNEVMGEEVLDLPPSSLLTRAFWFEIPDRVIEQAQVGPAAIPGTVHAAEHAGISILPLFTICDRWDVGGVSTASHPQTGVATIVIYDGYPGGAGIAELGYSAGVDHVQATLAAIEGCRCQHGCPGCVQSPKCGNGNDPLDKDGARRLLTAMLRR